MHGNHLVMVMVMDSLFDLVVMHAAHLYFCCSLIFGKKVSTRERNLVQCAA